MDFPDAANTFPAGINDNGQIVGRYLDAAGNFHGFLATPVATVPEPASFLLLSVALIGLAARRRA